MGCLAGPIVCAVVVLHRDQQFEGCTDAKQIPASKRETLAKQIRRESLAWRLGAASPREVESLNPRGAISLALKRAMQGLRLSVDHVLVDGRPLRGFPADHYIVKGDQLSHSIACASIIAKVTRDRLMVNLDVRYPEYGWAKNKGYATRFHRDAVHRFGPTPHHRFTYTPVVQTNLPL